MASVRCIVFSSGLRSIVYNSPRRLLHDISKSFDIGCNSINKKGLACSGHFLNSHKIFAPRSQSNFFFQSPLLHSKIWKCLTPELSAFRCFSSEKSADSTKPSENTKEKDGAENDANLTVFQRFKKTYKEHGKILVIVHCLTSVVWFGSFYMAAVSGVDIIPWMEKMGFSETIIKPFRAGGLGFVALAYLMYKLATPARYTVTLGGTNYAIKYLRKTGKMNPIPKGENLRTLYKDGKSELKERHVTFQERQRQRTAKFRKDRVARRKDS